MSIEQMFTNLDLPSFINANYYIILWALGFVAGMRAALGFYRSLQHAKRRIR